MFTLNLRSDDNVRGYSDVTDWRLDKSPITNGWVVNFRKGAERFSDVLDGEFVVKDANGNVVEQLMIADVKKSDGYFVRLFEPLAVGEEPVSGTPESCSCDNVSISAQAAIRIVKRMNMLRKAALTCSHGLFQATQAREWVQRAANALGVDVNPINLDPTE